MKLITLRRVIWGSRATRFIRVIRGIRIIRCIFIPKIKLEYMILGKFGILGLLRVL